MAVARWPHALKDRGAPHNSCPVPAPHVKLRQLLDRLRVVWRAVEPARSRCERVRPARMATFLSDLTNIARQGTRTHGAVQETVLSLPQSGQVATRCPPPPPHLPPLLAHSPAHTCCSQLPWVDLGKLACGISKQAALRVQNTETHPQVGAVPPASAAAPILAHNLARPGWRTHFSSAHTAAMQTIRVTSCPDWLSLVDAEGAPGPWTVGPQAGKQLQLQALPAREGRLRELVTLGTSVGLEAKVVVSAAAVKGAGVGLGKPQRIEAPASRSRQSATAAAAPHAAAGSSVACAAAAAQPPPCHGEKRGRGAAGLGTPNREVQQQSQQQGGRAAPQEQQQEQGGTPSAQVPKRARDIISRLGGRRGAPAPDPSTPVQPRTMQLTQAPGSIEAATPGRTPLATPRQQQQLAQRGSPGLHRLGGGAAAAPTSRQRPASPVPPGPAGGSAGSSPGPKTFTGVHTAWMDKQERAFKEWLNTTLLPVAADPADVAHAALSSRRLAARVRGLLWRIYSRDSELIRWGLLGGRKCRA